MCIRDRYHINVPYKIYWGVLKKYNISFGYPRSDTCSYCDSTELKIKTAMTDEQKQQLRNEKTLHLNKLKLLKKTKRHTKQRLKWVKYCVLALILCKICHSHI